MEFPTQECWSTFPVGAGNSTYSRGLQYKFISHSFSYLKVDDFGWQVALLYNPVVLLSLEVLSSSSSSRRREDRVWREFSCFLKTLAQEWYVSFLLSFHWIVSCHMATSKGKGNRKMPFSYVQREESEFWWKARDSFCNCPSSVFTLFFPHVKHSQREITPNSILSLYPFQNAGVSGCCSVFTISSVT